MRWSDALRAAPAFETEDIELKNHFTAGLRTNFSGFFKLTVAAAALFSIAACGGFNQDYSHKPDDSSVQALSQENSATVDALAQYAWRWLLEYDFDTRVKEGLPIASIRDITTEQIEKDAAIANTLLTKLDSIDLKSLSQDEIVTVKFLQWYFGMIAAAPEDHLYDFVIAPYTGIWPLTKFADYAVDAPLETQAQRDNYHAFLHEVADHVAQMTAKTRLQATSGLYFPKPALTRSIAAFEAIRKGSDIYRPEDSRIETLDKDKRRRFVDETNEIIETRINLEFDRLLDFLSTEYLGNAQDSVGLSQYPGGAAQYQKRIKKYTSYNYTPRDIHEIGLHHMETLQLEMTQIRNSLGFEGDREGFSRVS